MFGTDTKKMDDKLYYIVSNLFCKYNNSWLMELKKITDLNISLKLLRNVPYRYISETQNFFGWKVGVNTITDSGEEKMNPSTEDILKAIEEVNADQVIILPNNKNIFMAADQAAEVADIPVVVVPSRTISQGMTAMLAFNDQNTLNENKEAMTEMLDSVISGSITHAIRDTTIDGVVIKEGNFLGMIDGKIVVAQEDILEASVTTLEKMMTEDTEIITIIIGEEGSQKVADKLEAALLEMDEDLEIEIHVGDQPVYPYLFSAE